MENEFRKAIKVAMKSRKISLTALAKKAGVSRQHLSAFINGSEGSDRHVSSKVLGVVFAELGVIVSIGIED